MGGGFGGMGGGFPGGFGTPATNFAQPWLDGHYPSYDLNDRSQYWRGYSTQPGANAATRCPGQPLAFDPVG